MTKSERLAIRRQDIAARRNNYSIQLTGRSEYVIRIRAQIPRYLSNLGYAMPPCRFLDGETIYRFTSRSEALKGVTYMATTGYRFEFLGDPQRRYRGTLVLPEPA